MLYAARGIGKTHLALSVAHAVASGGTVLGWRAPRPAPVLYIDGEMPMTALQERYAAIVKGSGTPDLPSDEHLRLLPANAFRDGLPDLSTEEGRALLLRCLGPARLVVIDNLSTLVGGARTRATIGDPCSYSCWRCAGWVCRCCWSTTPAAAATPGAHHGARMCWTP